MDSQEIDELASTSPEVAVKADSPEEDGTRKKRRQNVACDSCKLRRIKCDLLQQLLTRHSTTDEDQIDISAFPEVACSACINKEIRCTRVRAMNPTKPKRGGKRIEEAKRLWGDDTGGSGAEGGLAGGLGIPLGESGIHGLKSASASTVGRAGTSRGESSTTPVDGADNPFLNWAWSVPDGKSELDWAAHMFSQIPLSDVAAQKFTPDPSAGFNLVYGSGPTPSGSLPLTWELANERITSSQLPSPVPSDTEKRKRRRSETDESMHLWHTGESVMLWGAAGGPPLWNRAEAVSSLLVDRALGSQLSRQLIGTFFRTTFWAYPCINPDDFMAQYNSVERTDQLQTPGAEALCAIMEAWASRYSDLPVILGSSEIEGRPPAHWGNARLPVCNALLERARKLVEDLKVLRQPTIESIQALHLFANLVNAADTRVKTMGSLMESRLLHTNICASFTELILPIVNIGQQVRYGDPGYPAQAVRFRSGPIRTSWTMMISDSMWAVGSRSAPRLPDQVVKQTNEMMIRTLSGIPYKWCKALVLVYTAWHEFVSITRDLALRVAVPSRQPGQVDLVSFCVEAESIFPRLSESNRFLDRRMPEYLDPSETSIPQAFGPLYNLITLRSCHTLVILLAYQMVMEQLSYRKDRDDAQRTSDMAMLGRLTRQSVDQLLANCRSQARMIRELLSSPRGADILRNASLPMRCLIRVTQVLSQTPCNEQGYPANTIGGFEFTWEHKAVEVEWCLEAIELMGWSWADSPNMVAGVRRTMDNMRPSNHTLATYTPPPLSHSLGQMFMDTIAAEHAVLLKAMDMPMR